MEQAASQLLLQPPHLRAQHEGGFKRYLATGEASVLGRRLEVEGMRKDGSIIPVELAITEVKTESAHLFTAYLRDLTQARKAASDRAPRNNRPVAAKVDQRTARARSIGRTIAA